MSETARTFLKVWLIVWVIALPLVHIHPEADHAHGIPGHVHGGTYHTVLSNTPICAYEGHQHHHNSFSSGETFGTTGTSEPPLHPPHGLEHSTLTFSVLNSSIDPILEGMVSDSPSVGVLTGELQRPVVYVVSRNDNSPVKSSLLIVAYSLAPRAPPILLV